MSEEVRNAADLLDSSVVVDRFYTAADGGIEKVIGKDLIIEALTERASTFSEGTGKYFTVTAEVKRGKGKTKVGFNTGSQVLIRQLSQLKEHLPVHAIIERVKGSSGFSYYQIKGRPNHSLPFQSIPL